MPWLLLDVALVLTALLALALVGLRVWREVKALGREVAAAGEAVAAASEDLARLQDEAARHAADRGADGQADREVGRTGERRPAATRSSPPRPR